MGLFSQALGLYLKKFPVERGKWRLWQLVHPHLKRSSFVQGEYSTLLNFKMDLDPNQYIDKFIYYWGIWEPDETHIIRNTLRSGDTFVDVGANAGYFTLLASFIVGREGHVHSIEPVPPTVARLRDNLARNNVTNVTVHEKAAVDRNTTIRINQHGVGEVSGMNSIRSSQNNVDYWDLPGSRIDEILSSTANIRLIKLDVEGAELLALKGAQRILISKQAPIVLCEVTDFYLREVGGSAQELSNFMRDSGYAFAYDCHNRRLERLETGDFESGVYQRNVVFSKNPL